MGNRDDVNVNVIHPSQTQTDRVSNCLRNSPRRRTVVDGATT